MPSFTYYLKNIKSKEETPIYLRYNDTGVDMKFYIGKKIHPKNWNDEDKRARQGHKGYSAFNAALINMKSHLQTLHTQLQVIDGTVNTEKLREKFNEILEKKKPQKKQEKSMFFTDYFVDSIRSLTGVRAENTIRQYKETLKLLRIYELNKRGMITIGKKETGGVKRLSRFKKITLDEVGEQYVLNGVGEAKFKTLKFDDVNLSFHRELIQFMTKAEYSRNWIGKTIKNIKLFMADAEDDGLHENRIYLHRKFTSMDADSFAIYLNIDELNRIYNYDFSNDKRLNNARDLFIIGCWTGLRYSDLSQLTQYSINRNRITSLTIKTGEKVIIPIHPHVYGTLDKYSNTASGLPSNISPQKLNDYIKEIGEIVGINDDIVVHKKMGNRNVELRHRKFELMQTHTMRRSFATNHYKMKVPPFAIMMITGHKTETAFMKYIKVSREENAEYIDSFWKKYYELEQSDKLSLIEA